MAVIRSNEIKYFYYSPDKGFVRIHNIVSITVEREVHNLRSLYSEYDINIAGLTRSRIDFEKMINKAVVRVSVEIEGAIPMMNLAGDSVMIVPLDLSEIFK